MEKPISFTIVEDVGKVEKGDVETIGLQSDGILHTNLYAQNPEGLDEQVEQQYPK